MTPLIFPLQSCSANAFWLLPTGPPLPSNSRQLHHLYLSLHHPSLSHKHRLQRWVQCSSFPHQLCAHGHLPDQYWICNIQAPHPPAAADCKVEPWPLWITGELFSMSLRFLGILLELLAQLVPTHCRNVQLVQCAILWRYDNCCVGICVLGEKGIWGTRCEGAVVKFLMSLR